jgi:site-specific DNA recombinase
MANVILYARVSTDEQAEKGTSIEYQKERLHEYCSLVSGDIVVKYFNEDFSAKKFENRPAFNNLLGYIKANKGLVSKIWVVRWDRFSRNAPEAYQMITKLKKLGVEINAIEQPIDFKIPEQKMLLSFYLTIPEIENDRRSLNTTNGMRKNLKEGRYVSTAPFGFKNSRDASGKPLLIHGELAPLIQKAFKLYATGTYQKEILRKELYKQGLRISKNQFCLILTNPIYCGKIRIKAFGDEPEEIVQGVHEPIISEDLFYEVQQVLEGKKKIKTKYARINEEYPLRGFVVCPICNKNLTGSSSKGNGGTYYYYHCTKGCKERHKTTDLHNKFLNWLSNISFRPEIGSLYLAVMEDVFKENEGDRNSEIKKLECELKKQSEFMDLATEKLIIGDLDKYGYQRMKENNTKKCAEIKHRILEYKSADSGYMEYAKYGISLLSNMSSYYSTATIESKQKMLGLIFPEKLIFTNSTFQTTRPNEILTLLCSSEKGLGGNEKKMGSKNAAQSYVVTPSGFKPETF